jgi:hypothetical protein
VCSLVEQPDGSVRLVMDDAVSTSSSFPQVWQAESLFTWQSFSRTEFLDTQLSDKELIDIGLNVAARLAAYANRVPGTGRS